MAQRPEDVVSGPVTNGRLLGGANETPAPLKIAGNGNLDMANASTQIELCGLCGPYSGMLQFYSPCQGLTIL